MKEALGAVCVASAGNRELARLAAGDCRYAVGVGVFAPALAKGLGGKTAWQGCLMCLR